MHVSVQNPAEAEAEEKAEAKIADMREQAGAVFAQGEGPLRHKEVVELMVRTFNRSEVWGKKTLGKWLEIGVVSKDPSDRYVLAQQS